MINSCIAIPPTIFAVKSPICRIITLKREENFTPENAAFISTNSKGRSVEKGFNSSLFTGTTPFKKTSVVDNIPFPEYQLEQKVEKIRKIMARKSREKGEMIEELVIIDAIQRRGLEDYFREEINATLERHYQEFWDFEENGGLYEVSLRFRLLRQNGFNVPAEIFNKFKDKEGKFQKQLCKDIKGLLSLYESSQLSTQGDDILDEASDFSGQLLKASLINNIFEQSKAKIIENTLRKPQHKNLARVFAKTLLPPFEVSLEFLHDLGHAKDWINEVLDLARIDFDMAQMNYKHELSKVSKWGKEVNSAKELDFARVEPFESYMWSLGTFPGPNMSDERIDLAKAVSFVYIIDDIFDICGTFDELRLFTEVVNNRWENVDMERLPNYMKVCFTALRRMTNDISCKVLMKFGWNPQDSLRKLWGDLCNAYLTELKWSNSGELPSSEEYLQNGIVSSGIHVVLGHAFFLLGQGINKKSVDELHNLPSIISSTGTVVRLWNDVGICKDESRDGSDGSFIDCYMNEHKVSSLESAREHVSGMIQNAWKCLNEEHLSSTSPFSVDFRVACLNSARMVPIMYSHDETHHLQFMIKLLH